MMKLQLLLLNLGLPTFAATVSITDSLGGGKSKP